jgi:hypothetical protein
MAYNPLIIAAFLLAVAGVAALPALGAPMGVGHDRSLQLAVIHAELAACVLLLFPRVEANRAAVARNLLWTLACFAAASAVVMLLHFAARENLPLHSRPAALGAWMFAGGVLALGARLGGVWTLRLRLALLAIFALPALAHYLALEYAGASLLHLRGWSPNWALAADRLSWLPLLPAAALPWAAALALKDAKEEHAAP